MKKRFFIKAILFVVFLLCLLLFINATDFSQARVSLQHIGAEGFLLLFMITGAGYWMATLGWKACIYGAGTRLTTARLFLIRHVGEVVAMVNPTSIAGGEATKIVLLRQLDVTGRPAVLGVMASRIILILSQLAMFAIVAAYLLISGWQFPEAVNGFLLFILVATVISVSVFLFLIRQKIPWLPTFLQRSARLLRYQKRIKKLWLEGMLFFRKKKKAIWLATWYSMWHWVLGGLEFYCILHFLGTEATLMQALFVDLGVIYFKTAGAFVPGQIGVEELGNKVMLESIGVPGSEIWITASILRRARQLCWILLGLLAYFILRKTKLFIHSSHHGTVVYKS